MNKLLLSVFALFVASVTASSVVAQEIKGDAAAGKGKIAMCIGCHGIKGYQGTFPEVYKVPMIAGQGAKYIMSALHAYQAGDRKHPTMRGIAASLTDQDIADVAAYYESLGKVNAMPVPGSAEPSGKAAELVTKGACESCHGKNFSTPIDPTYPKIAGQHADYLFVALKSYKNDEHKLWGRGNAIMAGVAKQFSNDDLKELAKYVHSLPTELETVPEVRFK